MRMVNLTDIFEFNLVWLRKHAPKIADLVVSDCSDKGERLDIEIIEGRDVTVSVNGVQLTSRHDRFRQAETMCSHIKESDEMVHVYGPMLGDCVQFLLKNRLNLKKITIHILNAALFKEIIRMIRIPGSENERSDIEISWVYDRNLATASSPRVVSVSELVLADSENQVLSARLDSDLERNFSSRRFTEKMRPLLKKRISQNLELAAVDADVSSEYGLFAGQKIAVLGAGPSLEMTENMLRELIASGVKIVAVETATRWMTQKGLSADYVVTIDSFILPDVIGYEACRSAKLVYAPTGGCEFLRSFLPSRRLCFYSGSDSYYDARKSFPHSNLFSSGSVIHPAVDFAVRLGAAEIFLFGCDFAFDGDKTHAGVSKEFAERWLMNTSIGRIPCRGWKGNLVETTRSMRSYCLDLGDYICKMKSAGHDVKFVNMSPWGAPIRGTEIYFDSGI